MDVHFVITSPVDALQPLTHFRDSPNSKKVVQFFRMSWKQKIRANRSKNAEFAYKQNKHILLA